MISVRALSAIFFRGQPVAAGVVMAVPPVEAFECVASTRFEYVFPEDRETAIAAARASDEKACAFSGLRPPGWVKEW